MKDDNFLARLAVGVICGYMAYSFYQNVIVNNETFFESTGYYKIFTPFIVIYFWIVGVLYSLDARDALKKIVTKKTYQMFFDDE